MGTSLSRRRQWLVLFTVTVSVFMSTLDSSIINIALPSISKELSADINAIQWIVTSYLLTISTLLPIWGRLSDMYGRKNIFVAGFFIFTLGSTLCGFSSSLGILVLSRVIQALGASCMMALSQGIIATTFAPEERGRALGINGAAVAIGNLSGPAIGGVLVHAYGWESIFFVNLPVGIAGVILSILIIPAEEKQKNTSIVNMDYKGSLAFMVAVLLLFTSLLLIQENSISATQFIIMFLVSIIAWFIFIVIEKKINHPLIDLKLFYNPVFTLGIFSAFFSFIAIFTTSFFTPFYLQNVLSLDTLEAGIIMATFPFTTAFVAPISGWLSDRFSYKVLTSTGLMINAISLFIMSWFSQSTSPYITAIFLIFLGVGSGLFQSPNTSSIMRSVSKNRLGIAGSINALFRNLGMVTGITLSIILFTLSTRVNINNMVDEGSAFNVSVFLKGFRIVMIFASASCLSGFILSIRRATWKKDEESTNN